MDAATILFVGHACSPTGFARVIHSILKSLPGAYDLHHYGINLGDVSADVDWTLHGNPTPETVQSTERLREVMDAVRPRIVVMLDEPWVCEVHASAILDRPECKTILYAAIDSDYVVPPSCVKTLARLDRLVAFTEFGRDVLRHRFDQAGIMDTPRIDKIPHGVDTSLFYPVEGADEGAFASSRLAARAQLFGPDNGLDGAFIVLNANRNQPFKRIDLCLQGFAQFSRDKPNDVKLYLHMGNRPSAPDELPLVDQLGIRDRIIATTTGRTHPALPSASLNLIYNACDVGINTSEGEGWGLIAFEHAATGAAQIVPRHSACVELWRESACLIDMPEQHDEDRFRRTTGRTAGVVQIAEALETLYRDHDKRRRLARAAFQNATRDEYDWRNIALTWHALFVELLGEAA